MAIGTDVVGNALSGTLSLVFWLIAGALLIGGAFFWSKKRKESMAFNIPVTIFIPRTDNKTRDIIHGKGGYFKSQAVGGITTFRLKRKGVGTIEMPPPASRFLVGMDRELFLVQKGMDDFEPILPESFSYVDTEVPDGKGNTKKVAVINLKCVNQDATAWKFDNEQNAKKRFTFNSFWEKYKDFIQITIFILIVFIASYIQYSGLKEVATMLSDVAKALGPQISNAPIVT
jgi:LPXTG-motif cell wall-anchored protein